ncbi:MAG: Ribosomal protein [Planctomycetota bacterium]|nr:MAG: Ribosomal protein [Planctomycetota bacterium]
MEHEKLNVYHKSLDLSSLVATLCDAWPIGKHFLLDQLLRASTSVVLNIAEGAGEHSPREKARFYRMSLRSATECSAIFDVALRHSAVTDEQRMFAREILIDLVSMLTKLVLSVEGGPAHRSHSAPPAHPVQSRPFTPARVLPPASYPPRKSPEPFGGAPA